jgi:PmbA protein
VVLAPIAVQDLLGWLQAQLSDVQLIAGSSLYHDKVGERIASPLLTLGSRFDAPGVAAISADAFVTPPVQLLRDGVLCTLMPSLYGSRKTGLPHVPTAGDGWALAAGDTPLPQLIGGVARGALVGRLSMGNPAANGDFSGVIKNSFLIERGEVGPALAETMIAGNVARMLQDVRGASRERIDAGQWLLPWLRIEGLHFS